MPVDVPDVPDVPVPQGPTGAHEADQLVLDPDAYPEGATSTDPDAEPWDAGYLRTQVARDKPTYCATCRTLHPPSRKDLCPQAAGAA